LRWLSTTPAVDSIPGCVSAHAIQSAPAPRSVTALSFDTTPVSRFFIASLRHQSVTESSVPLPPRSRSRHVTIQSTRARFASSSPGTLRRATRRTKGTFAVRSEHSCRERAQSNKANSSFASRCVGRRTRGHPRHDATTPPDKTASLVLSDPPTFTFKRFTIARNCQRQ
jgi:hypothetical protein